MPKNGPRSATGKAISSLNSLTHGLNVKDFLPCKQHRCYFIDLCRVKAELGEEALLEIPYGSACPVELVYYDYIADGLAKSLTEGCSVDDLHQFIMLSIQHERQLKFNAIYADITRDMGGNEEMALAYRYRQPIAGKLYRLMQNLFDN